MNKGIVMELDASNIIVMTPEGRFSRIPLEQRDCQIGEEIYFNAVKPRRTKPWIMTSSIAALAAAIMLLLFNLNPESSIGVNKQIVAYVSIDINPSVVMGIDEHNIVLELRGVNQDGTELIEGISFAGKSVDTLTEDLLQKAESKYLSKGEGDIIISSTMQENGNLESKVIDEEVITKLKEVVVQHIEKAHPEQAANYQVTAFAADKAVRKAAESKGVSAGKYTIYLNAKDKGQATSIDDLKKESVHSVAQKAGGLDKLVEKEELSKEKTSKLLKDDESGVLDRKLQKRQDNQKNKDKKAEEAKKDAAKIEKSSIKTEKDSVKTRINKDNKPDRNKKESNNENLDQGKDRENSLTDNAWLNLRSKWKGNQADRATPAPGEEPKKTERNNIDRNKTEYNKQTRQQSIKETPAPKSSIERNNKQNDKDKDKNKDKNKDTGKDKKEDNQEKSRNVNVKERNKSRD